MFLPCDFFILSCQAFLLFRCTGVVSFLLNCFPSLALNSEVSVTGVSLGSQSVIGSHPVPLSLYESCCGPGC